MQSVPWNDLPGNSWKEFARSKKDQQEKQQTLDAFFRRFYLRSECLFFLKKETERFIRVTVLTQILNRDS